LPSPPSRAQRVKKGRTFQTHRCRWLEGVSIRDGKGALTVNWLSFETVNSAGKVTNKNSWVTSRPTPDTFSSLTGPLSSEPSSTASHPHQQITRDPECYPAKFHNENCCGCMTEPFSW
jgi:hypothetical protein